VSFVRSRGRKFLSFHKHVVSNALERSFLQCTQLGRHLGNRRSLNVLKVARHLHRKLLIVSYFWILKRTDAKWDPPNPQTSCWFPYIIFLLPLVFLTIIYAPFLSYAIKLFAISASTIFPEVAKALIRLWTAAGVLIRRSWSQHSSLRNFLERKIPRTVANWE